MEIFGAVGDGKVLYPNLAVCNGDSRRGYVPGGIVQDQRTLVQRDFRTQFGRPFFLFFFDEECGGGEVCFKQAFFVVGPADLRLYPVVFGIGFQVPIVAQSFGIVVGCLELQVYPVFRVVTGQIAGFEHGLADVEFRQIGLEAEAVVQVIVMSCDTSLGQHRKRQFQGVGYGFRIFDSQQEGEIVFHHLLFLLRDVDQSRDIPL